MTPALHAQTKLLPGKRLELVIPELEEGTCVDVFIMAQSAQNSEIAEPRQFRDVVEFIDSLPPSNLTMEDWERIEREFKEEREAWGD